MIMSFILYNYIMRVYRYTCVFCILISIYIYAVCTSIDMHVYLYILYSLRSIDHALQLNSIHICMHACIYTTIYKVNLNLKGEIYIYMRQI